jgi:outer membrane protein OmpA-like peptidoglycan-associated protein/uncharacterized protein YegL
VLDHSGSIGDDYANLMQEAVIESFKELKSEYATALIKFDTKIETILPMVTNRQKFINNYKANGLSDFGGSTALLDGTKRGIEIVDSVEEKVTKNVIVLTDGYDNSSTVGKNKVLQMAYRKNVNLYTIGLGASVDEVFLQSISFTTGGDYYHIDNEMDIRAIFDDIYRKMKNNYTLRFTTPYPGKFFVIIEWCKPNSKKDSLVSYFSNFEQDNYIFEDTVSLSGKTIGNHDTLDFDNFHSKRIIKQLQFKKLKKEFLTLKFPKILFDFDTDNIVAKTDKELINVINFMKANPETRIEVQGHTDNQGTSAYNEILSQKRAEKVKKLLVLSGIEKERIQAVGYGENKPVAPNTTEAQKQKNRRGDFIILEY